MSGNIASTVQCPECGKTYKLSHALPGKKARCRCGCEFEITAEKLPADDSRQSQRLEISDDEALAAVERLARVKAAILSEVGKAIIGQKDVLEQILTGFFAGGHCLLLGVPGLAKTLMVHSLAQTMHLRFKRIQFTPDLMPTDITGTNILEEDPETRQRSFAFHKGPIFTNVLLADEINRTPPKTQAALLEAMQEHQVTTGGNTYDLPSPFLVLATQNPLELEGTYPLPEAQLDRFILLIKVDYPDLDEEQKILLSTTGADGELIKNMVDARSVTMYQDLVRRVPVSEHVANYAARLCRATRPQGDVPDFIQKYVRYGCGPRAGQSLLLSAKAHVVLNGRFNVSCDDIRKYALPVMRHRVILNFTAASEGLDSDAVINRLLETISESQ
ncbi:MAG TPA: MoxR family ATPase [Sedimentisphaerales bacterium]|nr:MoxR family ATPase [Sedimentisphaerales bacterium]